VEENVRSQNEIDEKFDELYRKYYRSVLAFMMRLGFTFAEAEDLTQETFCRAYRGMERTREAGIAWLAVIARNIYRNKIRALHADKRAGHTESLDHLHQDKNFDPAFEPERPPRPYLSRFEADFNRHLRLAIGRLPASMRQCLVHRMQGLSYSELAIAGGVELDTVKSYLYNAKKRLAADPDLRQFRDDTSIFFAQLDLPENGSEG
jgi:RNA polymerase sigma-70 factor, ECF subfamily